MAGGLRGLIDMLFPAGEARKKTSELIELGLRALRDARDERAVIAGAETLVPSRFELRLSQGRYDELAEMGGVRDIAIYFNDELMKEMRGRRMRTFGDHPLYVTIAADPLLQPNEIYAAVLTPVQEHEPDLLPPDPAYHDRTSVLGAEMPAAPAAPAPRPQLRLVVRAGAPAADIGLEGTRWVIGRRGASGQPLREGYRKIDLDLPATVSREQVLLELIGGDRLRIERVGKAAVRLMGGDTLAEGESRLLPLGASFTIEQCEIAVVSRFVR